MRRLEGEALLLRTVDLSESDRIVHLLTPMAGRVAAIAKGARRSVKRFPGTLDVFNHLRVQLDQRRRAALPHLAQAVLLSPHLGVRREPARFGLASYQVELLDRLAPEGGPPQDLRQLFDFALRSLQLIERGRADVSLRTWLELATLDALGLRPQLRHCVRCGREPGAGAPVAFHVGEGGVLCERCATPADAALLVSMGTLRALQQGLTFPLDKLDRLPLSGPRLEEAARLVDRFRRFHVGVELRSERVMAQLLPPRV